MWRLEITIAVCDTLPSPMQQVMVRHEAAEALSVLGGDESYAVLREFVTDERKEVSETCQVSRKDEKSG